MSDDDVARSFCFLQCQAVYGENVSSVKFDVVREFVDLQGWLLGYTASVRKS